jgi:amino-acid N-acetyltransferase
MQEDSMHNATVAFANDEQFQAVLELLARSGLPIDGLAAHQATTLVALQAEKVAGCAAWERYGDAALLRSVAVEPALRNQGLGQLLLEELLARVQADGIQSLYLLTESAATYFTRWGFEPVARAAVAPTVQSSIEFTSACPQSAQAMHLALVPARVARS